MFNVSKEDIVKLGYQVCLNCGGSGIHSILYNGGGCTRQFSSTCTYCNGKGYVTKESNEAYKINQKWLKRVCKSE